MQRLTEDQRTRVEEMAREAGTRCEGCGSTRLRCGEEARHTYDRGLMVYLWCDDDVHPRGAYQYFTIPAGEIIGT